MIDIDTNIFIFPINEQWNLNRKQNKYGSNNRTKEKNPKPSPNKKKKTLTG